MKAYIYNASDREARARDLTILELRTEPNGGGRFLNSATASSSNESSLRFALEQLSQWATMNGYEIER